MKKLFTLFLRIALAVSSYATHLMGGQITAAYLGSDSTGVHYAIDFTAYRDTIGIPISPSATFYISQLDTSGNWNSLFSSTVSFDTTSGNLMPTITVYGVEVYTYMDTITLPGNGEYSISWSDCCRNVAIINMSNPGGENLALATYITVDSLNINSSPYYLTPPVAYLPADTLWQYNPLPFDPDGDSLVWTMVTPLTTISNVVSGYQFLSDTSLYSNVTGVFSLDSITGALSWDAAMVGNFVASFIIEEFRNGNKIGEMRRDMQFIVVPDTMNAMPQISNMQTLPTNNLGYPYIKIAPGQNYQVSLLASDPDLNDVVSLEAYGESFGLSVAPSNFNYVPTGNGNEIEGTFAWTPDMSHVRSNPYLVVFRTSDNFFYYDETVQIEVALTTDINEQGAFELMDIYPNPAADRFILPLSLDRDQEISLDIYNVIGVKVSSETLNLASGNHILIKNINLNSGQYFVSITDDSGLPIITKKLIVVK